MLSAVVPGLGQMYNGQLAKGGGFLAALCIAALLLSFLVPLSFNSLVLAMALLLVVWIVVVVDAFRTTRTIGQSFVPRRYNKPWAYVLAIVVVLICVQPIMAAIIRKLAFEVFEVKSLTEAKGLLPGDFVVARAAFRNDADVYGRARYVLFSFDASQHMRIERTGLCVVR